jgi:Ca2+-binding RTX toxin-like protein
MSDRSGGKLNGGNGNDGLWGFDGNAVINCDAGDDYVEGSDGNDTLARLGVDHLREVHPNALGWAGATRV